MSLNPKPELRQVTSKYHKETRSNRRQASRVTGVDCLQADSDKDMLPVLRKLMTNDFEGYRPPPPRMPESSLLDAFEHFGAPQVCSRASIKPLLSLY